MEELFVSYEFAKLAREKGFDEHCFMYWRPDMDGSMQLWYHQETYCLDAIGSNNSDDAKWVDCTAPLHQQIVDWFREKHNLSILIEIGTQEFSYIVYNIKKDRKETGVDTIKYNGTYYEALNKAIEEAFKLI